MAWLVVGSAFAATLTFLVVMRLVIAQDGLLTQADLVGYAVCHRMERHSFLIAGRQLPLCARCSGTFLGALVGFFGQAVVLRRRRAAEFPPPFIIVILACFMLLWAADGLNSYLADIVNGPHLYEPHNWLRMTTGALNGLTMSALVYPVFNFTLWRNPVPKQAIRNLRDLGVLLLLEACLVGLVFFTSDEAIRAGTDSLSLLPVQWPFLLAACHAVLSLVIALGPFVLYPLAFLSALGVMTLLTSVNSMLVLMLIRRENTVDTWRAALVPLLAGFTVSLVLVGVIDVVRYTFTGTLTGIPPLQ
jgi:uncharacterized membrane protein